MWIVITLLSVMADTSDSCSWEALLLKAKTLGHVFTRTMFTTRSHLKDGLYLISCSSITGFDTINIS